MQRNDRKSISAVLQRFRWVRQLVGSERVVRQNARSETACVSTRSAAKDGDTLLNSLFAAFSSCYDSATYVVEMMRSVEIIISQQDPMRTAPVLVVEIFGGGRRKTDPAGVEAAPRLGVPEYWQLDVTEGWLGIYCDPQGVAYQTRQRVYRGGRVNPPGATRAIAVADLLP